MARENKERKERSCEIEDEEDGALACIYRRQGARNEATSLQTMMTLLL